MDQPKNTINIGEFLSVAVLVAEASGNIIRKVQDSGELQKRNKD